MWSVRHAPVSSALMALLLAACSGGEAPESPTVGAPAPEEPSKTTKATSSAHKVRSDQGPVTLERTTQSGRYTLELSFDPPEPPMGELFAVEAVVRTRTGEPLETGSVTLDARMPQHNHGMMTDPVDLPASCPEGGSPPCPRPEGRYRTEGFKFHMTGEWTITAQVDGPLGSDSTSFVFDQR